MDGIFIQASEEELAEIWEACAAQGFTMDSKGILALLLLAVRDEGEEDEEEEEVVIDPVDRVLNHFTQNPEHAAALKDAGAKWFRSLFTKPKQ